jgi:nucleoside phosphorylase
LKAAYNAEELVNAGERATLLTELSSLKRNLLNNVKKFIEPAASEQTAYHISDSLVRICNNKDFRRSPQVSMAGEIVISEPVDFLIITALEKERGPVSKVLQAKPLPKHHEDSIRYEAADISISKDERYIVRLMCVGDQGSTYTAAVLSNALARYHPRYVVMTGIAAVVPGEKRKLRDILVSTDIVDLTDQKQWPDHAEVRKRIFRCDRELVQEADRFYKQSRKWSKSVKMGAIISQTDLVKSAKHRDDMVKLVRETEPALKVVGLEREGSGLGASPEIKPSHLRPGILMVKSAVDFANYFKNDKVQKSAATRSAEFLLEFLKSRPVGVRAT